MNPKRLRSEIEYLARNPAVGIEATPDESNTSVWKAKIAGPAETVYEGYNFYIHMKFPPEYPMKPPCVTVTNTVFHPNIGRCGSICVDFLGSKWTPVYNIQRILVSLQSLLSDPYIRSPLNGEAARSWPDKELFLQKVQLYMKKG